jgi:catechol 2,3-dioxygenase-like lactoylglutathione lyase family enzyme
MVSLGGLSTLDSDIAQSYRQRGLSVWRTRVAVRALADVCREYATGDILFLKIDVEGAEGAVLRGADFATYRPSVVLAEATLQLTQQEAYQDWEPLLLNAGYRFVWFDGLNRFYVAAEHRAALSPHFRLPPYCFDDFRRADSETHKLAEALANAEAELQALRPGGAVGGRTRRRAGWNPCFLRSVPMLSIPRTVGILETSLYVEDIVRARDFYERVFGFEVFFADARMCALGVAGGQVLLLFRRGATLEPAPAGGGLIPPHHGEGPLHVCFAIPLSELPAWEAHLQGLSIAVESRLRWSRGGTSLYFRDLDDNSVEVATPGLWPHY